MPNNTTEQKFPLTKQQQGLWIEWKLHPENTSYNTCVKVKLKGKIDKEQLSQALNDIVQYFDSLKVYFVEDAGIPYQCIKSEGAHFLQFQDISVAGQEETSEQAQQGLDFLSETLNTPIDLTCFPIVRAALMKVAEDTHYFIGMVPHMISDGRSAILFLESLSIAYNDGYQGLKDAYDTTSKSWADFYQDKRNILDVEKHQLSKQHWQQRLAGANHYFDYSYGRKIASKNPKQGHRVYFDIPAELAQALKTHTGKNRTTLFNVMVCAFGIFIHRYFGLTDMLVGFPISIRPPGYKHLFGFFVNIVPIRINLSGDPSYQELLAQVAKSRKEDKRHQKFPALDIVNAVREQTADFDGQLFNLSMAQTVSRLFNLELDGVETQALESEYNDVNDDLSLSYEILEDGIGLWFEYRTSMFDQQFINQGIAHIRQILEQMTSHPETKLSEFKLLSKAQSFELMQLAKGKLYNQQPVDNNAESDNNVVTTVVDMFEHQAHISPEAIALRFNGQNITYLELNQNANQLARQLINCGFKNNQAVAVCLNRGTALITTLLAVFKAGGHYIPIAPDYPEQRLHYILQQTDCQFVIHDTETAELCTRFSTNNINYLQNIKQRTALAKNNLNIQIKTEDNAYIIYTSGSTGTPKGVPISHGNLVPRLTCLQQEIPLTKEDVMLQSTDFSFDVSVAEIFWPLTAGASLVLSNQQQTKQPEKLIQLIDQHQVTTSCMVPSLLNAVLLTSSTENLSSLKYMLAAGEVLNPILCQKFYEQCSAKFYNFYGPTEATIYSTFYYCDPAQSVSSIPIGRPLLDTQAYILDKHLQVQAKGVAGELFLSGKGISTGYINQPELNKSAFISNPFTNSEHDTLYRTGDLCRYLEDGNIDFLGRIDQQVKIRGYRIELSEIEIILSSFSTIIDVAVIAEQLAISDQQMTSQRLIAYFVSDNEQGSQASFIEQLKHKLSKQLPAYMIPALFLKVAIIPRSQSGKVLLKQLPAVSNQIDNLRKYNPPVTKIENQLVDIWASILKLPRDKISINDSFFELGGDSLMAIQFISAAEEQSLHLQTAAIFDSRTIAELATLITHSDQIESEQETITGEYPLTARQYKFFNDNFLNPHHWNRQFSFDVMKKISTSALTKAFQQVLQHHDALSVKFVAKNKNEWVQISCLPSELEQAVFYHDLSQKPAEDQHKIIRTLTQQAHQLIRLDQAPLIKLLYFKLNKNSGAMVIISHHLLLDMVSSRIVFEDLMKSYEYQRRGIKIKLANKTSSLKQWTEYLQSYANLQHFQLALDYWGNFPINPSPKLSHFLNEASAKNIEAEARTITLKIGKELTERLLIDIPSTKGYKIQDLLLVALLKVTREWTNDNKLMVNICGHGRNSGQKNINLSRTVGWVNTVYPVRLDATDIPGSDIEQLVQQVIKQLDKVPTNNMDYNILRYIAKHPSITQHHSPEIFFNYVGQLDAIIPEKIAFKPTAGMQGISEIDGCNKLCYLLYFEAGIIEGRLNIRLTSSDKIFKENVIDNLSISLKSTIGDVVNSLIQHPLAINS